VATASPLAGADMVLVAEGEVMALPRPAAPTAPVECVVASRRLRLDILWRVALWTEGAPLEEHTQPTQAAMISKPPIQLIRTARLRLVMALCQA
jgi:hypothetical protein